MLTYAGAGKEKDGTREKMAGQHQAGHEIIQDNGKNGTQSNCVVGRCLHEDNRLV